MLKKRKWGPSEVKRQAQGPTSLHLQCADYSPVSEAEWGRGTDCYRDGFMEGLQPAGRDSMAEGRVSGARLT